MLIEYEHEKFIDTDKVTNVVWRTWTDPSDGYNHHILCISGYGIPDIEIVHNVWCNAFAIEKKIKEALIKA